MKFIINNNSNIFIKILFLLIFIPVAIIVLFIAVPIIISIAFIILILMYFTGRRFNRNLFFFKANSRHFAKKEQSGREKQKNSEYYDAEYTSIDDKETK
jgi:hypothetical protein